MKTRFLSPIKCIFCKFRAASDKFPVCRKCLPRLNALLTEKCKYCGKLAKDCKCGTTAKFVFFFRSIDSKRLIYNFKYNSDRRIIKFIANLTVAVCELNMQKYDGVTFVPRLLRRKLFYGYDQAKEFAKAFSKKQGIPVVNALKRRGGKIQKLLSRAQRAKNIKNKFEIRFSSKEKYNRLLLVDDVTTTGATIEVCADILKENSIAKNVTILALSKTVTKRK